ncbi:hypothetical protein C10C_0991 [Chlamydia serpentis]|uniref:Uncharacterized protein n=1 Tax=Chlamydia serpentis TaxID=1967782 RepID=A0A2R8FCH9_9CHLA|nr:hypothetical protein [Chlamydia serpentis]SPN74124.1 hypothetical protein C10C_0991 [Chlamydia serpentis]
MTIPSQTTSTSTTEVEVDFIDENSSEETSTSTEVQCSLLQGQQHALLRPASDLCVNILMQAEAVLSQATPSKEKPLQEEQLLVKTGMLTKSLSSPNLKSSNSQESSSSPYRLPIQQQGTSAKLIMKETSKECSSPFPFSSCRAPEKGSATNKTIMVSVPIPKNPNKEEISPSQSHAQIKIETYSNDTIKEHCAKEKASQHTDSKEAKKSSTTKSDTLSPMSLYGILQKETLQPTSSTETHKQDEEHQDQGQQEKYEHEQEHEQGQKKKKAFSNTKVLEKISSAKNTIYEPYVPILPDPIVEFALSEAQLSILAGRRVTNLDVLKICTELMKLMLKSRANDTISRLEERELMEREAQTLAESYARQAKYARWLGIATATLGILGALSPMIGEICGDSILGFVQRISGRFKDATSKTFFKGAGKICTSLSQLTDAASKVHELSESSVRAVAEYRKEVFRMRQDEITRSIEEVKDNWKSMDNFLLNILQTEHDAARSLYQ